MYMQFNEMLNVIDRIESIDENTTADYIDDLLGDVYYLLARECKDFLDSYKDHLDEIVDRFGDSETLPKPQNMKPVRVSPEKESELQSKPSSSSKQRKPTTRVEDPDEMDYYDDDDDYDDGITNDRVVVTKTVTAGIKLPRAERDMTCSTSSPASVTQVKQTTSQRTQTVQAKRQSTRRSSAKPARMSESSYMDQLEELINE